MAYTTIIVEKNDGWAKVTLNRPEVMNAINTQMRKELRQALEDAEKDDNIRVIVLTGSKRAFAPGADLKEMRAYAGNIYNYEHDNTRAFHSLFNFIQNLSKPVIAVISGFALAGGLEMALACDFIVASEDAKIGDQHANFGIIPGGGGTQRLPRIIGLRKALELMLTGDWISGKEAEAIGLINKSAPQDQLEEAYMKYVNKLKTKSPLAAARIKRLAWATQHVDLKNGLEMEITTSCNHFMSEDMKEGVNAFNEKRAPNYKGR